MARRTPDEVYAELLEAGFGRQAAIVMTAIAGAESGWDDTALGDVGRQTNTWGPSFGLFQIRTEKPKTGSGDWRDLAWLTGNDLHQAQAAYQISKLGTDFSPWTVYNTGAFQQHLPAAQAAADRVDPQKSGTGWGWPDWLPFGTDPVSVATAAGNVAVDAAGVISAPGQWLAGARHIAIEGGAYLAGAAVIGLGLYLLAKRRS